MNLPDSMNPITEDDIANYLVHNPDFFQRHAELLASVRLASPHGPRAVSLQERQAEMLRDKIRGLESRIMEMIRNGTEYSALNDRLLRWAASLLAATEAGQLPPLMVEQIQTQFMVPQAAIRLLRVSAVHADQPYAQAVSDVVKTWAETLAAPYCGAPAHEELNGWLADPKSVQSMAVVALRHPLGELLGLLVLASPDAQRYHAGMGTDLLERIGQLAGAALTRLVKV
ncbi:MAG: DUF484 family protein [Alphaproteobacteria bacterium]|nr:DUF484 family protein [Alphaproteobacteria bacterium]MDI9329914.1 DUF484 family protein [Alphaproteobacteria bacterium]